jgi:hypothetical protein
MADARVCDRPGSEKDFDEKKTHRSPPSPQVASDPHEGATEAERGRSYRTIVSFCVLIVPPLRSRRK